MISAQSGTSFNYVWDTNLLEWVPETQPGGGGGGTVTANQGTGGASAWLVTGPLTDTELRASAVPVSLASAPSTAVTQGTSPWVVGQATGTSLHTVVDSGAITATLGAGTALAGVMYDEPDDTWHQTHVPAANTQATITQASAGGSLKNVCTGFSVTICAGATAPTAIQLSVALIDGATGGSTYLWRSDIALPAAAGAIVSFNFGKGKWTGSTATAMTLEFSVAGGASTFESVTMKGYTK